MKACCQIFSTQSVCIGFSRWYWFIQFIVMLILVTQMHIIIWFADGFKTINCWRCSCWCGIINIIGGIRRQRRRSRLMVVVKSTFRRVRMAMMVGCAKLLCTFLCQDFGFFGETHENIVRWAKHSRQIILFLFNLSRMILNKKNKFLWFLFRKNEMNCQCSFERSNDQFITNKN